MLLAIRLYLLLLFLYILISGVIGIFVEGAEITNSFRNLFSFGVILGSFCFFLLIVFITFIVFLFKKINKQKKKNLENSFVITPKSWGFFILLVIIKLIGLKYPYNNVIGGILFFIFGLNIIFRYIEHK